MPTSKKRGGKKAHRKKVQSRNQRIQNEQNKYKKDKEKMFEQIMKEYEAQAEKQNLDIPNIEQIEGVDGPEL